MRMTLLEARLAKRPRLSQGRLAVLARMNQSQLSRLERNGANPVAHTIDRLESALKLAPGTLFFGPRAHRRNVTLGLLAEGTA